MTERSTLNNDHILPAAHAQIASFHPSIVKQVSDAVSRDDVVVVGMAGNPYVKHAREALTAANIAFTYLEFGSYFSQWKQRLAIKMWSGWPTFPQVFVRGSLLGGADLTKAAIADGSLRELLKKPRS